MKKFACLCLGLLCGAAFGVRAQGMPSPPGGDGRLQRPPPQDWTPEQREQWREERRQQREAWHQMSPADRQQLRQDIRESGRALYPRERRHRPD